MRNIGRIILLAVGGVMIALAVTGIIANVEYIKDLVNQVKGGGIQDVLNSVKSGEATQKILSIVLQAIFAIAGISAVLSAIFNHAGFWFTIFAIIILAILVTEVYFKAKTGVFTTDEKKILNIFVTLKDFALLIGYSVGFLLMKFAPKKQHVKAAKK